MSHLKKILPLLFNLNCEATFDVRSDYATVDRSNALEAKTQNFSVVILDSTVLTQTFQRFFATEAEIFQDETDLCGKETQHRNLGAISYVADCPTNLNGYRYREINQAYIKTLRTALLTMCKEKVQQEMEALDYTNKGESFPQHVMVKRNGAPQVQEVEQIMSHMFGYQHAHYGAQDYVDLMTKNLQNTDNVQKLQDQYILLCMAIGQDPRVYLR